MRIIDYTGDYYKKKGQIKKLVQIVNESLLYKLSQKQNYILDMSAVFSSF